MNALKIILLCLALCSVYFSNAQIIDLGNCAEDELSNTGLTALKEEIGNARVVIIGEQNHGVGTDYESFGYLVKFLHEEMGFNVIAQEYSFFYFGWVNAQIQRGTSAQKYRNGMYWPQGLGLENDVLFDYIDEQAQTKTPMIMEGFDPRFFQRKAFYTAFDSLLTNTGDFLLPNSQHPDQLKTLDNLLKLEYNDTLTGEAEKAEFLRNMDCIISNLQQQVYPSRMIQVMKNVVSFANNAWNPEGYDLYHADRFHVRSRQMAENLFWLMEEAYPNEKIIVRVHNGHGAKSSIPLHGAVPDTLLNERPGFGSLVHERYGDACLHLASTYYSGTYCNWNFQPIEIPKPQPNSIEEILHGQGYNYAYMPLREGQKYRMNHSEFNTWVNDRKIETYFGNIYDGVIFINHVALPTKKEMEPH